MRDEQVDMLASHLGDAAEQLADLALDLLSEAMSDADPKASPAAAAERVVTRARRSVVKAIQLLEGINRPGEPDFD